jgi:hypothetical protein
MLKFRAGGSSYILGEGMDLDIVALIHRDVGISRAEELLSSADGGERRQRGGRGRQVPMLPQGRRERHAHGGRVLELREVRRGLQGAEAH